MEVKTIALAVVLLGAFLASVLYIPKQNYGFDNSWDCPVGAKGAVVCVKKH